MAHSGIRKWFFPLLFPLSLLYGTITALRNILFNRNILRSVEFDFPVISVGNITVGGTGKTPHVEYLLELLLKHFKVAFLSRGYKRKTKGFLMAGENTSHKEIGDEPYQVFRKYKEVPVAVSENRVYGIKMLKQSVEKLNCVVLDDAFQHRYVHPGISILLIDYHRPMQNDYLLPLGNLRESKHGMNRADIVIVTKVPCNITPIEKRLWLKELNVYPYQLLYFTGLQYGKLTPVFGSRQKRIGLESLNKKSQGILLVTGIANPLPLYREMFNSVKTVCHINFPDHYEYSLTDIAKISHKFDEMDETDKIIVTTEKDSVKIASLVFDNEKLKKSMYYLPVTIKFLYGKKKEFDDTIRNYVKKNKRIGYLHC